MGSPKTLTSPEDMFKLWAHETARVFRDRLIDDDDRAWFDRLRDEKWVSWCCLFPFSLGLTISLIFRTCHPLKALLSYREKERERERESTHLALLVVLCLWGVPGAACGSSLGRVSEMLWPPSGSSLAIS